MAARTISAAKFADLVRDRLMDADEVAQTIGVRSRQAVYDRVERGTLPPPILKRPRAFAFWDRRSIERHINTEVSPV